MRTILMVALTVVLGVSTTNGQGRNVELLGSVYSYWDRPNDIAVAGQFAYIADCEAGLKILNVSDPTNPIEAGNFDTYGFATGVTTSGNFAYVADGDSGLRVIDVSNPNSPIEVGFYAIGGEAVYVEVVGNLAYVIGRPGGLSIIDVSNPQRPYLVGHLDGEYSHVVVSGRYAYLVESLNLHIIDVSTPSRAWEAGLFRSNEWFGNFIIAGELVYLIGRQLHILDVSDLAHIHEVGTCEIDGFVSHPKSVIIGRYIFATLSIGLAAIDVSDRANPVVVGRYHRRVPVTGVALISHFAYLATYDGLQIIDVADPANMEETRVLSPMGKEVTGVAVQDGYVYVTKGDDGIDVVDVSDKTHPIVTGSLDTPGAGLDVTVAGAFAYIADGLDGGLRVVDISNPQDLVEVGSCDLHIEGMESGDVRKVVIQGEYAYLGDSNGMATARISDPTNPVNLRNGRTGIGNCRDLVVSGDYAYLAVPSEGFNIFYVGRISPRRESQLRLPHPQSVAVQGMYSYVGTGIDTINGMQIIDCTDKNNPVVTGLFKTPDNEPPSDITVIGDHAFVVDQESGFYIVNISDKAHPIEVGYYNTPGVATRIAVEGNYAYVGDKYQLEVFDISAALNITTSEQKPIPLTFSVFAPYPNPFNSTFQCGFTLPRSGYARLTLDELTGREVANLAEGNYSVGDHSVIYSAGDLSSGVYVVRARFGGETRMARVMLLK